MISANIENLIIQGAAFHKVLNIGTAVFNYNLGRGTCCIVENIHIQNTQQKISVFVPRQTAAVDDVIFIDDAIQAITKNAAIFTINIYDGNQEQSITVKNKWSFAIVERSQAITPGYLITGTSILDFNTNVFWKFTGENLTFEITEIRDSIQNVVVQDLTPYVLRSKKVINPIGFTLPNPVISQYSGGVFSWNVRQMGKQVQQTAVGTLQDGFIIPRSGTGDAGNIMLTGTGKPANMYQPILNIGIIELNESKI